MNGCTSIALPVYADSPCYKCKVKIKSGRCRNWCNKSIEYKQLIADRKKKQASKEIKSFWIDSKNLTGMI